MNLGGVFLAVLSGAFNGLFTTPMRLETRWKWENTWLLFIVVACLVMPLAIVLVSVPQWKVLLSQAPASALYAALGFGFAWGFGAICFGQSVDRLGVSIANSLVIGLSSGLGSLVPLLLNGHVPMGPRVVTLLAGVAAFLIGVAFCGAAGLERDRNVALSQQKAFEIRGYVFATASGVMSAIFNIGFTLALPITDTGRQFGISQVDATNCIWLAMLSMGAIPNIAYCLFLMNRNKSAHLFTAESAWRGWLMASLMGLLWGGSIFLYGAAVPKLGAYGPSIGWPLSLAVGLLVANLMGLLLREWQGVQRGAVIRMQLGLATIAMAIVLCGVSARMNA